MTDSLRYEVSQLGIDVVLIQLSAYPTNMYASCGQPEDQGCVSDYGAIGEIPAAMFSHFMGIFESDSAPKLHDVAQAILSLANTPKGKRVARTVVGTSFGADILNDSTVVIQSGTVKALGLGHLETIAVV